MNPYATKLAEEFAETLIVIFFEQAVAPMITNDQYEGQIKDKATIVNIMTIGGVDIQDYDGSDMTPDDLEESVGQLNTNQSKGYYFKTNDLAELQSFVKDPEAGDGGLLSQVQHKLIETIDSYVLGFYTKVAAGNRDGVDYVTGTVTVTTVTGAVVGSGTTFTSAMVGRGFQASGQLSWYRVKSYASGTSIVIEDDLDDVTSQYTGGAVSGGTSYTIEAVTAVQVTAATLYSHIVGLRTKLNKRKIPKQNRWLVLESDISGIVLQMSQFIPSGVPASYTDGFQNGQIGRIAGFDVYENEQVHGDGVNGYRVMAGHTAGITFGMAMTRSEVEPFIAGNFGKGYKGLNVYGAKVVDERRKCLAEGFWKL